jgi:ubiquinone/menaquinone biosynthesis C-methylase UbiE
MAGLQPGEVVLDIGSGGGIDVFLAANRVGPTGLVYGIDMTPAMLQRARKAAKKGGYTNVKFRYGFAEKLPVDDASIDVILSNCVINLTEDKGCVFREAFRVLKKGGQLEVNDMVFGGAVMPAVRASAAGWSECVSGALPEQEYVDLVRRQASRVSRFDAAPAPAWLPACRSIPCRYLDASPNDKTPRSFPLHR